MHNLILDFCKARGFPVGTVRTHGGKKVIKTADGKWKQIKGQKSIAKKKGEKNEHRTHKNKRRNSRPRKLSQRNETRRPTHTDISEDSKLREQQASHSRKLTIGSSNTGDGSRTRQLGSVKLNYSKTGDLTKTSRENVNQAVLEILSKNKKLSEYTDAEKSLLRLYSGSGGTKDSESTAGLTEFYTPYKIVDKMWEIARVLGLKKGDSVLEPSAGIGRITEGDKNKDYQITQLEQNKTSAKINQILHPHTDVKNEAFETLFMGGKLGNEPKAYDGKKYDLVLANPPYGTYLSKYRGMGEGKEHHRWEDYFIDKSLDTLKDGGHAIFLVPSSFLAKAQNKIREKIGNKAKLVDAYRLPRGIFAGSNIGTDLIILKKEKAEGAQRSESNEFSNDNFFAKHPDNILGEIKKRKKFGKEVLEVDGPFSNLERIGHKLSELTKQKISQSMQGNKNAVGARQSAEGTKKNNIITNRIKHVGFTHDKKMLWERQDGKVFYMDGDKKVFLDDNNNEEENKKPISILKKTSKKKTKKQDLAEIQKQETNIKEVHSLENFNKKYNTQFTNDDLELWSSIQVDGSFDRNILTTKEIDKTKLSVFKGKIMPDVLYASGNIYQKLDQLEEEEKELNPRQYQKQKKLLEEVLPKKKKASDIHFSPLSSFIQNYPKLEDGESLASSFIKWLENEVNADELKGANQWEIEAYVNQIPLRKDMNERKEDANRRRSKRREVAEELFNKFIREKLSQDDKKVLVDSYNRIYNSNVNPDYKKIPVFLNGLSKTFKGKTLELKPHQLEGLAYLGSSGKGIIAYDVGLGKTMLGITGVMQALQRGWAKKPVIVVPKSVIKNWEKEIKELFPSAKVNILGNLSKKYMKEDFKIKEGSISLITYEGMKQIGYKPETLNELTRDLKDVLQDTDKPTKRQRQITKEKAEVLAGKVQKGAKFLMEDLGFDHLTIDEAHNMKNVFARAKTNKGEKKANEFRNIQGASSERGTKAFLHSQYIQKNNKGRNVTLLTATPFTNSPIEIYSMLSHVSRDKLQAKGLNNVNDFMSHFVDLKSEYVIKGNGTVEVQDIAKGFKNLNELQEIVREAVDFKTGAEVKIPRPTKEEKLIELPLTEKQREIIQEGEKEYDQSRDNPAGALIAINKQRMVTLSPKLVTGRGHFVKDSPKLRYTFDSVININKKRNEVGQVVYLPRGIDYYNEVEDYLLEKGIKKEQLAFINAKTSDEKKQEIMDEFNDPKSPLKVIVGSETIKEGVNLQSNSAILYNTFLGWNPTEIEQVRGRIWRQGNKQKNVHIVYPISIDSIDSVMYQKHDEKNKRISEVWKFKGDYLDVSPIDPFEAKYEIIKDPDKRAKFKIQLETDSLVNKAEDLKARIASLERIVNNKTEKDTKKAERENELRENKRQLKERQIKLSSFQRAYEKAKKSKDKEKLSYLPNIIKRANNNIKQAEHWVKNDLRAIKKIDKDLEAIPKVIQNYGYKNISELKETKLSLENEIKDIETKEKK